jgi:TonB family protein
MPWTKRHHFIPCIPRMLLHLPTFNATLSPCPVGPAAFTPHADGKFCSSCQRVVQDFSQSENPVADLAAARAASPDGRVCGSFRREQVAAPPAPTLSRRLRWFIMALVLVVSQGLTAREALAQVRRPVPPKPATPHKKHAPGAQKQPAAAPERVREEAHYDGGMLLMEDVVPEPEATSAAFLEARVYTYAEQMPQLPNGGGTAAIIAYIQQRVRWPVALNRSTVEGRVYASFTVDTKGSVRDARIVKGLDPLLDAETLRVVQALPPFIPGRQQGQAVAVSFTVPITFKR